MHIGQTGGHKPGPVNLRVSRRSNSTALLEDVSVSVRVQVDEASLAPAFSSTSRQYAAVKIFCWSDFIVTFRSHLNSFVDGTDQPKWSQKLTFSKVVQQQYTVEVDDCCVANYFAILCAKYYGNPLTIVQTTVK